MKYFNDGCKFNFVDENNVFVGFDSQQGCCENADFFFCDNIPESLDYSSVPENYVPDLSEWRIGQGGMLVTFEQNYSPASVFLSLASIALIAWGLMNL